MNTRPRWCLLLPFALLATACPTRVVTDADAGRGGGGGSAGHATGGAAGSAGQGGASGQAGMPLAGAGGLAGSPAGGTSGQAGGAVSGTGGQAGAPVAGTGGQAGAPVTSGSGGRAGSGGGGAGAGGQGGASSTSGGTGGAPAKAKDGERCALASDCASGACTPFYVDLDGDSYGAGQALGFCGTTAPVGYAAQSGDCCDTATNLAVAKMIHPGADFQPTSAGGVCNITWDYDCSGKVETNPQDCISCTAFPACSCVIGHRPETACGSSGIDERTCTGLPQTQSCLLVVGGGGPGTIECK